MFPGPLQKKSANAGEEGEGSEKRFSGRADQACHPNEQERKGKRRAESGDAVERWWRHAQGFGGLGKEGERKGAIKSLAWTCKSLGTESGDQLKNRGENSEPGS